VVLAVVAVVVLAGVVVLAVLAVVLLAGVDLSCCARCSRGTGPQQATTFESVEGTSFPPATIDVMCCSRA